MEHRLSELVAHARTSSPYYRRLYAGLPPAEVDFMEVAPENWLGAGGRLGRRFRWFTERYPFICHGLSLSIGGPSPLDEHFLQRLKRFLGILRGSKTRTPS